MRSRTSARYRIQSGLGRQRRDRPGQIKARALLLLSDIEVARGSMERGLELAKAAVAIILPLADAALSDEPLQPLSADTLERSGNILGGVNTVLLRRKIAPAFRWNFKEST